MSHVGPRLFGVDIWTPALEKYGGVTHLTISLYDASAELVCGPVNPTVLFEFFAKHQYDPGLVSTCVRRCLQSAHNRTAVVMSHGSGLAVVGAALALDGEIVGAAVAGYHFLDFPQSIAIERLAQEARLPFTHLWEVVRQEAPVSRQRFVVQGELLQAFGDTILRETQRTRQYEEAAVELRAVAEELTAAAAAKDEFLAVLSHELRTPLTPILGWARILRLGADATRIEQAAEVIERNVLLQTKLVEDLLELTRVTRGKVTLDLRTTDIGEAIDSAMDAYDASAPQNHAVVDIVGPGQPLLIKADVLRLQQIFRNVLSNALKFTPPDGRITVTLAKEANKVVVKIRDTGEGIQPEFLPFVFDIFRQQERGTRRQHEGLGIGLALVKHLTELQGGRITLASEGTGHGTEVTIQFPLVTDATRTSPVSPPVTGVALPALEGLRLLVVEDMDDSREATRLILERLGADVLVAKDGLEGLEIAVAAIPDVVLCDLRMPRMDGFEFIRALHDQCGNGCPPVIAISGLASRADHARTATAGFEGHLDKPFDDVGLLRAVSDARARRRHT